ncbi:hypothetical protein GGF37_007444, partial [Kickxella alabastrina]
MSSSSGGDTAEADSKEESGMAQDVGQSDHHAQHMFSGSRAYAAATHLQTKLPPNSGSPSSAIGAGRAGRASSFSSSHSSLSPSPSINPYAGSLRNMMQCNNRSTLSTSPGNRTSAEIAGSSGGRVRGGGGGGSLNVSTMPANIRRSDDARLHTEPAPMPQQQPPLLPPRYGATTAAA